MKKNIAIGVLLLTSIVLSVWGVTQRTEVTRLQNISIKCQEMAKEQEILRIRAEYERSIAREQISKYIKKLQKLRAEQTQ